MKQKPPAAERHMLYAIPFLYLAGVPLHFIYQASGRLLPVGLFAPMNESIWEHMKLAFLPVFLCWFGYFLLKREAQALDADRWFTGAAAAAFTACLAMPLIYYFYHEGLGVHSLAVDISLLLVCIVLGQIVGVHVLKSGKSMPAWVGLACMLALLLLFAVFTVFPPHVRLFLDTNTGQYGLPS